MEEGSEQGVAGRRCYDVGALPEPKYVTVPEPFRPLVAQTEKYFERRFANFRREPREGSVRVDGDRYVLVRAESFYVGVLDGMVTRFGERAAFGLVYDVAHDIGRSDCESLTARMGVTDVMEKVAAGPPFFVHCGWGGVTLLPDSHVEPTPNCFLHFEHPDTFESEALMKRQDVKLEGLGACAFSAGFSAGWVSCALDIELRARELRCRALGSDRCEFIMCAPDRLDAHTERVLGVTLPPPPAP